MNLMVCMVVELLCFDFRFGPAVLVGWGNSLNMAHLPLMLQKFGWHEFGCTTDTNVCLPCGFSIVFSNRCKRSDLAGGAV